MAGLAESLKEMGIIARRPEAIKTKINNLKSEYFKIKRLSFKSVGVRQPPRYVSPPSASERPPLGPDTPPYWTLPARRLRGEPVRSLTPEPCLSSSTPNKEVCRRRETMDRGLDFSPIPRLVSPPRTSMTSEEIFAIIHRSKKRLNIRTESDCSLSPGSSECSLTGDLGDPGARNSWSPPGSACDRLGPPRSTTRHDFKRLLMRHGPGAPGGGGEARGPSAVERLRLARRLQGPPAPTSPQPGDGGRRGTGGPPRSPAWRFASPRSDVLSSTILEDCDEEERAERSPQHTPPRGSVVAPRRPLGVALANPSVRRPLDASFRTHSSQYDPRRENVPGFNNPSVCKPMEPIGRLAVGKSQNYQYLRNSANSPVGYPSPSSYDDGVSAIPLPGETFLSSQRHKTSSNGSNSRSYVDQQIQLPKKTPLSNEQTQKTIPNNIPLNSQFKSTPDSNQSPTAKRLSPRELFLGIGRSATTDTTVRDLVPRQSSPGHKYFQTPNNTSNLTTNNYHTPPGQRTAVHMHNSSSGRVGNELPAYYTPYTHTSNNQTTSSKVLPVVNNTSTFVLPIYNKPKYPELLSPSNVKENFNSFQIQNVNNVSPSKMILSHSSAKSNGSAGQPWNAQSSALISNQPTALQTQSPKPTTLTRNILGTIESKSPQKVSLETSL